MVDFIIKQNDTLPILSANIKNNNGSALNLSTVANIRFFMINQSTKTEKVNADATIVSAAAGTVSYSWSNGDTDTIGNYYGEFELTYAGGGILSVPTETYINIKIIDDKGSAL